MWWLLLVPALLAALYFLGILGVQLAWLSAGWNWGLPRWWRGRYTYLSGRLIRCFRAGRGDVLAIRLEGEGGTASLELRDRHGAVCYAWYGVRWLDTRVPVGDLGRFVVQIRAEAFRGVFSLTMEPV